MCASSFSPKSGFNFLNKINDFTNIINLIGCKYRYYKLLDVSMININLVRILLITLKKWNNEENGFLDRWMSDRNFRPRCDQLLLFMVICWNLCKERNSRLFLLRKAMKDFLKCGALCSNSDVPSRLPSLLPSI